MNKKYAAQIKYIKFLNYLLSCIHIYYLLNVINIMKHTIMSE